MVLCAKAMTSSVDAVFQNLLAEVDIFFRMGKSPRKLGPVHL